jgi:hypothetical protein
VKLSAEDLATLRSFHADADAVALHFEDMDGDVLADLDGLTRLPAQNQHDWSPPC